MKHHMAVNRLVGGCGLRYCRKSDSQQQRLHNTRGVRRTKSKFLIMRKTITKKASDKIADFDIEIKISKKKTSLPRSHGVQQPPVY